MLRKLTQFTTTNQHTHSGAPRSASPLKPFNRSPINIGFSGKMASRESLINSDLRITGVDQLNF